MRAIAVVAALFAVLPLPSAAGGKACQVGDSAVPTPGLRAMAVGSTSEPMADEVWLTKAQIDTLAEADTNFRRALAELDARLKKLPVASAPAAPELAGKPLPELVEFFLARAVRGRAILIDAESAGEFWLANKDAIAATKKGRESRFCTLCIAVRRGMEAAFRYEESGFGELTAEQQKELAEIGQKRDDLRRKWAAVLQEELTVPQLAWLREAQMKWLKSTLRKCMTDGMASIGEKACESCAEERGNEKCEFCAIITKALTEARRQVSR